MYLTVGEPFRYVTSLFTYQKKGSRGFSLGCFLNLSLIIFFELQRTHVGLRLLQDKVKLAIRRLYSDNF